ncbi:MAG: tryptophan synthase subunit alpha [Pseudomonadota bacterium]
MLETYIQDRLRHRDILLMTHIVLGYPDMDQSMILVEEMVNAGVDLMELQIPFSEPMADGPVILKANQRALEKGVRVARCFDFAREAAARFQIPFLFMTYYNIVFKYGEGRFAADMATAGLRGAIVPDLPPEEGGGYQSVMDQNGVCPIYIFSPTTTDERMSFLASKARGFVYCVARKGVTGRETRFSEDVGAYLARCRKATNLPLAVGFGVKDRGDVDYLRGKVDIAVVGSQTIRIVEEHGARAAGDFVRSLV